MIKKKKKKKRLKKGSFNYTNKTLYNQNLTIYLFYIFFLFIFFYI